MKWKTSGCKMWVWGLGYWDLDLKGLVHEDLDIVTWLSLWSWVFDIVTWAWTWDLQNIDMGSWGLMHKDLGMRNWGHRSLRDCGLDRGQAYLKKIWTRGFQNFGPIKDMRYWEPGYRDSDVTIWKIQNRFDSLLGKYRRYRSISIFSAGMLNYQSQLFARHLGLMLIM